jgi:hypothetical protein
MSQYVIQQGRSDVAVTVLPSHLYVPGVLQSPKPDQEGNKLQRPNQQR